MVRLSDEEGRIDHGERGSWGGGSLMEIGGAVDVAMAFKKVNTLPVNYRTHCSDPMAALAARPTSGMVSEQASSARPAEALSQV